MYLTPAINKVIIDHILIKKIKQYLRRLAEFFFFLRLLFGNRPVDSIIYARIPTFVLINIFIEIYNNNKRLILWNFILNVRHTTLFAKTTRVFPLEYRFFRLGTKTRSRLIIILALAISSRGSGLSFTHTASAHVHSYCYTLP